MNNVNQSLSHNRVKKKRQGNDDSEGSEMSEFIDGPGVMHH